MTQLRARPAARPTVNIAGVEIAAVTMAEAVDAVLGLTGHDSARLVVTPNVDHIVMLEQDEEYAAAYRSASLRLADGAPIVVLARLLGTPLPERVAGIDLTVALLGACEREHRSVYFLGGAPEHLERAIARVRADHPDLDIAGSASPTIDLDAPTDAEQRALAACRAASPDLLFVFLGAPKQEKWFARRAAQLPPTVVLAVGGTVDILAGAKRRAPRWVQAIGCEWLWRLALEPGRLFRRYVIRDSRFVVIATRAYSEHVRRQWARRRRRTAGR
jgi:N-acetylglucosaminyldiphosphoundecaprenol N-acetyl-beta-D-mannosaminyltransferase